LRKWKESLGLGKAQAGASSDPRKVIVHALALEVQGRNDISIDLSTTGTRLLNKKKLYQNSRTKRWLLKKEQNTA
jgi:hypothetical protein